MSDFTLKLDERVATGKQVAKLRHEGLVPSVVYGADSEPINTQSGIVETTKVSRSAGKHSPVTLTIDGKKRLAIIKTLDYDPVKHQLRHVAFHAIKMDDVITTEVPIHLIGIGESAAEKAGLVVLQAIEHVIIKAKPASLPESLELSIKDLATTDDKLTLSDIKLPEGVEFNDIEQDTDLVVANVYEPSALQAANDAAGGDAEDASAENVAAENGEDTPQGGADQAENAGGKKAKEEHGE
ncbi:MAG: rplY [Candidatus Saccharibacteria bacterium]|nr:rplY [Candidatus Saccharibacteria bacterium]